MQDIYFEYLTGTVTVPADAPKHWKDEGLGEFYRSPNDEQWGKALCRVLYHESIHFWQIFSSAYIGNLISDDWGRMLHYESSGEILPLSDSAKMYDSREEDMPFAVRDLVECWARYWDIHTRGAKAIFDDEKLSTKSIQFLEIKDPLTNNMSYTSEAYDHLMTHGPDSTMYAAPFRWAMEQANGQSSFVQLAFPILAHAAFGSPDPVKVFCDSFCEAYSSKTVQEGVELRRSGNINFDWLSHWSVFLGEGIQPILRRYNMPLYTSGFDVIHRGKLGTHPIYGEYLGQQKVISGHINRYRAALENGKPTTGFEGILSHATWDMAYRDPWTIFGLPGQPDYRYILGRALRPFRVRFTNYELIADRPVNLRLAEQTQGIYGNDTYADHLNDLDDRVSHFRNAEFAVSQGMPPESFNL